MSFQYAHHRPLTPITPVHSPQPSNGSIRIKTPGQLSLHEYRKQQVTPSPPAISGQRSIKKKRAASSLNKYERTPAKPESPELYPSFHSLSTPPLTPSLPAPASFTSHPSLPDAPPTRHERSFPEFSYLSFSPSTRQQLESLGHEPPDHRPSSSPSQLLPPSPPSHLQASPEANFLSSLFPFPHVTANPSHGNYQPISDENWEEYQHPGYFKHNQDIRLGSRKSNLKREHEQHQQGAHKSLPAKPSPGPPRDALADLTNLRHFVGSQAPAYVSYSARLPGIGRNFEEEQQSGLLKNDSSAQFPSLHSNFDHHQDHGNAKLQERYPAFFDRPVQLEAQPRERHFKSIKRLPRPVEASNVKTRPSPLTFKPLSYKPSAPPASVRHTSTSTLSSLALSQFPGPPLASKPIQGGEFPSIQKGGDQASQVSTTPTILHHRGASFDLLNPHDSLRLSDIRTPLELEDSDYFSGPLIPLLPAEMMTHNVSKSEQNKPGRAVFQNLEDAYKSIRKQGGPFRPSSSGTSTPDAQSAEKRTDHRGRWIPDEVNTDHFRGEDVPPAERSRMVKALQVKESAASEPKKLDSPSLMSKAVAKVSSIAGSIRGKDASVNDRIRAKRSDQGLSFDGAGDEYDLSESDDEGELTNIVHEYEDSNYVPSNYAHSVIDNRRSIPFGVQAGQTDYSEFSIADRHRFSVITQESGAQNLSTVSKIIEGYGKSREPEASDDDGPDPETESVAESYDSRPILQRPESQPRRRKHVVQRPETPESEADLSREITGLSDIITAHLSPVRDSNDFELTTSSIPKTAPSAVPTIPLPELPPDVQRPVALFAGRLAANSSSDVASYGQSYGDTRQLLDMASHRNLDEAQYLSDWPLTDTPNRPVHQQQGEVDEHEHVDELVRAGESTKRHELNFSHEYKEIPPKMLRITNPDSFSDLINPPASERLGTDHNKSESDSSDSSYYPATTLAKAKQNAHDSHSLFNIEGLRQGIGAIEGFESVTTITPVSTQRPALGVPTYWDEGHIEDMSDEAIAGAINDPSDWETDLEPSEPSLGINRTSMADYDGSIPPMPLTSSQFQVDPCTGQVYHPDELKTPQYYTDLVPSSPPQIETSSNARMKRPYVEIPDDQLSPEPDDSPAELTFSPSTYVAETRSRYTEDTKYVEPAPPEPAYYSPSRRAHRILHPSMEKGHCRGQRLQSSTSTQSGDIELEEIGGQRQYSPIQHSSARMMPGTAERQYRKTNASGFARASVRSQRGLQPLTMQTKPMQSERSVVTKSTRWSDIIDYGRRYSISEIPHFCHQWDTMADKQRALYPEHSTTENRRRRVIGRGVCTGLFIMGFIFCPLLIAMGMGKLDWYVSYVTYGEVPSVPRFWKKVARTVGWVQFAFWCILAVGILAYHAGMHSL